MTELAEKVFYDYAVNRVDAAPEPKPEELLLMLGRAAWELVVAERTELEGGDE